MTNLRARLAEVLAEIDDARSAHEGAVAYTRCLRFLRSDTLARALEDAERAEKAEARLAAMKRDAERYRWLRDASNLTLRTDGSTWTRADGNKFVSTHFLAVGDTQYGPCKSLDAAIDAARNRHD